MTMATQMLPVSQYKHARLHQRKRFACTAANQPLFVCQKLVYGVFEPASGANLIGRESLEPNHDY